MSLKPWIIWAETRTASAALAHALGSPLEDEPFLYNTPREHGRVYQDWCKAGDPAPLYRLVEQRHGIKHIAEPFDDNFNADLARACNHFGYRHVRLDRHNTFAQLASRGVAEQCAAWDAPTARQRLAAFHPAPLDAADLRAKRAHAHGRWRAVSRHLPRWLTLWTEDITGTPGRRRVALQRLRCWLEIPFDQMARIDDALFDSGQNTESLLHRVPNLQELLWPPA